MADFDGVADGAAPNLLGEGTGFEAFVMAAREFGGGVSIAREELEELLEALGVERELGWELPEDGAEFGAESEQAGGEEVGERLLRIAKLEHVSDVAAAFDGEDEVLGRLVSPREETGGALEGVERAVDFDGGEERGGVGEFFFMREFVGIEFAAPSFVIPSGDADADTARNGRCFHGQLDAESSVMRSKVFWSGRDWNDIVAGGRG